MKGSTIISAIIACSVLGAIAIICYFTGASAIFVVSAAILTILIWVWYDPQYDSKERLAADYQLKRWREMVQEMNLNNNGVSNDFLIEIEARLRNVEEKIARIENSSSNSYGYSFNNQINTSDITELSSVLSIALGKWDNLDSNKKAMLVFQLQKLSTNPLLFTETINIFKNINN